MDAHEYEYHTCIFMSIRRENVLYLSIRRGYLMLFVQLRWAMSEPLYVGRAAKTLTLFVKQLPAKESYAGLNKRLVAMTKLSDKAFAIMAVCSEAKKYYGVTVDEIRRGAYKFVWAFPIDRDKAQREGYDSQHVHGSIELDTEYPGCPYCKSSQFIFCSCGAVMCWHGQRVIKCPKCGQSGEVTAATSFDLHGGGF